MPLELVKVFDKKSDENVIKIKGNVKWTGYKNRSERGVCPVCQYFAITQ